MTIKRQQKKNFWSFSEDAALDVIVYTLMNTLTTIVTNLMHLVALLTLCFLLFFLYFFVNFFVTLFTLLPNIGWLHGSRDFLSCVRVCFSFDESCLQISIILMFISYSDSRFSKNMDEIWVGLVLMPDYSLVQSRISCTQCQLPVTRTMLAKNTLTVRGEWWINASLKCLF